MSRPTLAALSVLAILCASCGDRADERPASENAAAKVDAQSIEGRPDYSDRGKQIAWIDLGKKAIQAKLRDPDSAVFRNETFYSGGIVPVVCGEVNAKNGLGGMTGFERFFAAGDQMAVLESEMAEGEMQKMWDQLCR